MCKTLICSMCNEEFGQPCEGTHTLCTECEDVEERHAPHESDVDWHQAGWVSPAGNL